MLNKSLIKNPELEALPRVYLKYIDPYYNFLIKVKKGKVDYLGVIIFDLIKKYLIKNFDDLINKYAKDPYCRKILMPEPSNTNEGYIILDFSSIRSVDIRYPYRVDLSQLLDIDQVSGSLDTFFVGENFNTFNYSDLNLPIMISTILGRRATLVSQLKKSGAEDKDLLLLKDTFLSYLQILVEIKYLVRLNSDKMMKLLDCYEKFGEDAVVESLECEYSQEGLINNGFFSPIPKKLEKEVLPLELYFDEPSGILDNPRAQNTLSDNLRKKVDLFYELNDI